MFAKSAFILPIFYVAIFLPVDSNLSGFDDSVLYSINWQNFDEAAEVITQGENEAQSSDYQKVTMQTEKGEKYDCMIPKPIEKEKDLNEKYNGPNPMDILTELFALTSCSYRFEAYWTYQLCHGQFVRQYHEEREGKKVKLQEFFLGKWDKSQKDKLKQALEDDIASRPSYAVPVKKVDGVNMPYIQVNMSGGTPCDLTPKPRQTSIFYVCYALGKHEIYSLKEVSICEYEIIVLSPLLCAHPRYRPKDTGESVINCKPVGDTVSKPKALVKMEAESLKLRQSKFTDEDPLAVLSLRTVVGEDGIQRVRVEVLPLSSTTPGLDVDQSPSQNLQIGSQPTPDSDDSFMNFITGHECIQGGSGWWKYELCFGKSVQQYHVEKNGAKTTVNLGNFIKSGHLKWLEANPHKRPVPGSHLSYLYTKGSICEETGQPRQTEVKLKCIERQNTGAISLYLLEPRTCQYILGLESQAVCRILKNVDEDGMLQMDGLIGFSRADATTGYKPVDGEGTTGYKPVDGEGTTGFKPVEGDATTEKKPVVSMTVTIREDEQAQDDEEPIQENLVV